MKLSMAQRHALLRAKRLGDQKLIATAPAPGYTSDQSTMRGPTARVLVRLGFLRVTNTDPDARPSKVMIWRVQITRMGKAALARAMGWTS